MLYKYAKRYYYEYIYSETDRDIILYLYSNVEAKFFLESINHVYYELTGSFRCMYIIYYYTHTYKYYDV